MNENKNRKLLLILSIISVIAISFVPNIGFRIEEGSRFLGFPAEWLGLYKYGGFSFKWLGFLFNCVFFYLIFRLLIKVLIGLNHLKINKSNNNLEE
ncbi:hypothetical protein DVB69_11885 [Sporosarcina sp. BI001-red]|nr:hypothetical protein DVB69_11885 [Sporosarcina sp. BI001-red]